ncbi:MAG: hypothetical protein ABMA13_00305 [Chthoniobacteraceae bacterium]
MKRLFFIALLLAACRPPVPETLAARLLREDFTFAEWRATLGREPAAADLGALLDALTEAHAQAPDRMLKLAQDGEFRQRTLRTSEVRAQAMRVFGLDVPDGVPAGINQLLHTQPGDNCPVCRMREQTQKANNGL